MKSCQSKYFVTNLFEIRELTQKDISAFHEMQGNDKVMRYTGDKAHNLEENKADLQKVINHYTELDNQFWVWGIERKNDQALVGTCALIGDGKGTYEIGFRFLEKYWGQGYGTEICNDLIDYAFCQEEVKNIIAYVDIRNTGSVKILNQSNLAFVEEVIDSKTGTTDRFYKMEIIDGEEVYVKEEAPKTTSKN